MCQRVYFVVCYRLNLSQIRLAETQVQGDPEKLKPEQLEKTKKIEGWREELKLLESTRGHAAS